MVEPWELLEQLREKMGQELVAGRNELERLRAENLMLRSYIDLICAIPNMTDAELEELQHRATIAMQSQTRN